MIAGRGCQRQQGTPSAPGFTSAGGMKQAQLAMPRPLERQTKLSLHFGQIRSLVCLDK